MRFFGSEFVFSPLCLVLTDLDLSLLLAIAGSAISAAVPENSRSIAPRAGYYLVCSSPITTMLCSKKYGYLCDKNGSLHKDTVSSSCEPDKAGQGGCECVSD
jgi:hypothetical protein